jgi:hypothetical protein
MDEQPSLERLSDLTGEPIDELHRFLDLGLRLTAPERPLPETLERIRLARSVIVRVRHDLGDGRAPFPTAGPAGVTCCRYGRHSASSMGQLVRVLTGGHL